jgi:putative hydrolase of HD superfamily
MSTSEIIELLIRTNNLKRIKRSGWITAGIQDNDCETVAAHSWGTCLISLMLLKKIEDDGIEVDKWRVLELAIIHDLPEAVITDIPHSSIDIVGQEWNQAKKDAEKKAIEYLLTPLGEIGVRMVEVWKRSSNLESIESRIVAGADIVDMLVHAITLERNGVSPLIIDPFFTKSLERLDSLNIPILNDMYNILVKEHQENLQGRE